MRDERSFRMIIGLLALAWAGVGAAVTIALLQTSQAGQPMGIATVGGIVLGLAGLAGTWLFRTWGVVLYLLANLLLIVKPWLLGTGATLGGTGWGYWILLLFFLALVAANWNRFRGAHA